MHHVIQTEGNRHRVAILWDSVTEPERIAETLKLEANKQHAKVTAKGDRFRDQGDRQNQSWLGASVDTLNQRLVEGWPEGVSLHSNNILDDDFGKGVAEALAGMWKEKLGIDVQVEALEYQASVQWWQAQVSLLLLLLLSPLGRRAARPQPGQNGSTRRSWLKAQTCMHSLTQPPSRAAKVQQTNKTH